ncbi:MAG: VOC family protein [Nitrospinae bacterium]|nr:VOC family protein [Nitrospinota bacterium]
MESESALGLTGSFSFEFVVDFFDRSREFYVDKMGFVETHRSGPEWERKFNSKALYLKARNIRILLTTPKTGRGYTAEFLKILAPGVRRVTYQVENLDRAVQYLREHDATFIHPEKVLRSKNSAHRFVAIASPIGFLEFVFLEIEGDPEDIPMFEKTVPPAQGGSPFLHIDHMTINTRAIYPIWNFFAHVMGMEKFWRVAFHTPDHQSGQKGSGLSSQVMWDPRSRIKVAVNEPLYPHFNESQIQSFFVKNHGAGIQHVALAVDDLIETVRALRARGIQFLDTPDAYYDLLPERIERQGIGSIHESLEDLRRERILLDGKDGAYLLQIFLKDASLLYHENAAGPFFYEIIQRRGHDGFGENNFRALFEAIELQEARS